MKKLLTKFTPTYIATLSLLMVSLFLRYYLFINSAQLIREFKNQNYKELYSMDSLQVSSRLNSLSTAINWVCLEGSISNRTFFKMQQGRCETGLFQQKQMILIPQANNTQIIFTVRLPKEVEVFFIVFLLFQGCLILALINSTKRMELARHLNEAKINKIARQVSHDIRSPLATLNTLIDSIADTSSDEQKLIKEAVLRINNISNNLLINSHKDNYINIPLPIIQAVQVNKILEEIINEKKVEYSNKHNINLSSNISEEPFYVILDSFEFKRSISNIINNSVEACKQNQPINIKIELKILNQANIEINIEDDGKGIPKELIKSLGTKEITSKTTGNGIGLIHTFESIENWNGKIFISSTLNTGTLITIQLPLEKDLRNTSILLDDDELVRITWKSVARKQNKILQTYSSFEELNLNLDNINKESTFYIDSNLGNNIKGENVAKDLFRKGFANIYMTTGYAADKFEKLDFLKGVLDKSPPWKS